MLDVRDIHTYYGDSYILQGLSLHVEAGSIVAVLGRNGVGKSTLIRSIIGFTPPRTGSIQLDGEELTGLSPERIVRKGVGLVPQGRRIFGSLTVRENLLVGERAATDGRGWSLSDVFGLFPRLQERLFSSGKSLSGGEQQMLACSRALVGNPKVMLMDEPTEGLSPLFVRELGKLILELRSRGSTVLLIEQNLGFALRLADFVYVMNKGQIVHASTPSELAHNDDIKGRYLGM
ncbi:MAG: ABC transporter ATP-binding protein [Chloroflexota bacterium]